MRVVVVLGKEKLDVCSVLNADAAVLICIRCQKRVARKGNKAYDSPLKLGNVLDREKSVKGYVAEQDPALYNA